MARSDDQLEAPDPSAAVETKRLGLFQPLCPAHVPACTPLDRWLAQLARGRGARCDFRWEGEVWRLAIETAAIPRQGHFYQLRLQAGAVLCTVDDAARQWLLRRACPLALVDDLVDDLIDLAVIGELEALLMRLCPQAAPIVGPSGEPRAHDARAAIRITLTRGRTEAMNWTLEATDAALAAIDDAVRRLWRAATPAMSRRLLPIAVRTRPVRIPLERMNGLSPGDFVLIAPPGVRARVVAGIQRRTLFAGTLIGKGMKMVVQKGESAMAAPDDGALFDEDERELNDVTVEANGPAPTAPPVEGAPQAAEDSPSAGALPAEIADLQVDVVFELATLSMSLADIAQLESGAVLDLHRAVTAPVRILVGDRVIGSGTLVQIEGWLGVQVTATGGKGELVRSR